MDILHLIGLIYESVDDADRWSDFLDALLEDDTFAAAAVGYQADLRDFMITGVLRGPGAGDIERLYSEILPDNPLMKTNLVLASGPHVLMDSDIMEREAFERTHYYEWLTDIDADRVLASVYREGNASSVHFPCYVRRGREVTPAHRELVGALLPHVRRALALSRTFTELQASQRHSLDAIGRAHFGCVLIGKDGQIGWMNEYADAILSRADSLTVEDGTLRALHPEERSVLDAKIEVALGENTDQELRPQGTHRVRKVDSATGYIEILVSPLSPLSLIHI